jgi:transposase
MTRHHLTDDQWECIKFLLPSPKGTGRHLQSLARSLMVFYGYFGLERLGGIYLRSSEIGALFMACSTSGMAMERSMRSSIVYASHTSKLAKSIRSSGALMGPSRGLIVAPQVVEKKRPRGTF